MSVPATRHEEAPFWHWWRVWVRATAVVLTSGVAGASLVALSWRFEGAGPLVLLGIALVPFVAFLIAADPRVALFIILAVLPFSSRMPEIVIPRLELIPLNPLELSVIFAVIAIAVLRIASERAPLRWFPELWIGVAIFGWSLITLRDAADLSLGLKQVGALALGVFLIAAVASVTESSRDLRAIATALVLLGAAIATYAFVTGTAPQARAGGAGIAGRFEGSFDQPNQLGSFAALTLFVAIGLGLGARTRGGRLFGWGAAVLITGSVLFSLSRGAWIGTALGGLYLLLVLPRARRTLLLLLIPFLAVALTVGPSIRSAPQVQVVGERLSAFTAVNPYDDRPAIYREARRQIEQEPITGHGPGSFPVVSERPISEATTTSAKHGHNIWLTWAAEMGLPAALLITILMVALGTRARRAARFARSVGDVRQRGLVAGITASLITVAGQGVFDYTWRDLAILFSICIVAGLLLSAGRLEEEEPSEQLAY